MPEGRVGCSGCSLYPCLEQELREHAVPSRSGRVVSCCVSLGKESCGLVRKHGPPDLAGVLTQTSVYSVTPFGKIRSNRRCISI